jgi:hypothetical protein
MMETSMGDVVNLKRFRKRTEKESAAKQADANRARFGRTKSERELEKSQDERAKTELDQHRLDGGDAS